MMGFLRRALPAVILVGGLMISTLNIVAQQSTGSLRGQVMDQLGALIVGASVTLTDANGVSKTATTNNEGNFVMANLAAGRYIVRCSARSFAAFENHDVVIFAGRITKLEIKLGVTLEKQEVTVGSAMKLSTEPENNASALVLGAAEIEGLPDDEEEIADILQALAGPSAGPNGGQIF